MDLLDGLRNRKSIRAYENKEVPRELLERIIDAARWSPSWGNTQPWAFTVAAGEPWRRLAAEMTAAFETRQKPNPDVAMPGKFPDAYQSRYMECAAGLFGTMGLAREDKAGRMAHMVRMTGGFGAPAAIYVMFGAELAEPYSMFDLGAITHGICLAAHALGLGSCIEAQLALYPDLVRRHLELTEDYKIVVGIAVGYPDLKAPANAFRTSREPLEKLVRWAG